MLPDIGADENIIGPRYLRDIGLSISDLKPPPDSPRFTADGSVMKPALGSFLVDLKVKEKTTRACIDVHAGTPVPLLSYNVCRDLALIAAEFPQPISQVIPAHMCASEEERNGKVSIPQAPASLTSAALSHTSPQPSLLPPTMDQALPFDNTTSPAQAKEFFLREYSDVLMTKEDLQSSPLYPMKGPPMQIHLREDARPFAIYTPWQIPLAFWDAIQHELAQGIIAPAGDDPSPWCHPRFAVQKPNGGVRITTDLSHLNRQVSRPAHSSPTPFPAIRSVDPQAQYFTTIDALQGYWQLELAEEDQALTIFITPYGRFKYLRGPMGFAATGDAFCLRGDKVSVTAERWWMIFLFTVLRFYISIVLTLFLPGVGRTALHFMLRSSLSPSPRSNFVDSCYHLKVSTLIQTKFVP
ncbi:Retrovirus-related Pol polyprotein [Portunus trituberculatus]|uniref:Retrovirus-related Pol polyprotein n=1 Tax=Portunus trituberculatus TaxID=210409 RepID=A0A5B7HS63_PORTR|nr:Retrovirus-related Pol polyprotein [Portunus trituberculatus]